jgi:TonB family protein
VNACYRNFELPWTLSAEQERRYRKILLHVCGVLGALSLLMPWLPVPEPDPQAIEEIPQRFARLVLEKPAPPPPPVLPAPEPEPVRPEPVIAERAVVPQPDPVQPVDAPEQARDKAAVAGLLPFADQLADLRENRAVASVTRQRELTGAVGEASRNERSLITSKVGTGSGGINTAALSRDTGGGALAGRATTQVTSPVAGAGDGGAVRRSGDGQKASRSREEIETVFDRNKGAIYALYNRALRGDPTLQGKLVLRLTIAPSGEVTQCEVVSSELDEPDLERKLVARVKLFRFEEKDVEAVTTTKPIDFFPA